MKKIMILHRLILEDKERLRLTTELMTTFLGLFLEWIKFGKGGLDEDDNMLEYVPTHYLTCMSEFHQMYYNMEDNYFSRVPKAYVSSFPSPPYPIIVHQLLQFRATLHC